MSHVWLEITCSFRALALVMGNAAAALPGSLSEMQIRGPYSRPQELSHGVQQSVLTSPLEGSDAC